LFSNALSEAVSKHIPLSATRLETLAWQTLLTMRQGTICLWRVAAQVAMVARMESVRRRAEGDAFRCLMQRGLEALDRFAKVFGAEAESLMMDRNRRDIRAPLDADLSFPPCPLTRRMQSLLARADVGQRVKQRNRTMPPLRGLMLLRRVQAMEPPDVLSVSEPMPLVMVINNLRSLRAMWSQKASTTRKGPIAFTLNTWAQDS
jgi:hypothetical protein